MKFLGTYCERQTFPYDSLIENSTRACSNYQNSLIFAGLAASNVHYNLHGERGAWAKKTAKQISKHYSNNAKDIKVEITFWTFFYWI